MHRAGPALGNAALQRVPIVSRNTQSSGNDTEMLRTRLEENAARTREREQKKSREKKGRRKHPLLERMRLRRRTAKYGDVLPAAARAAMERPPATAEDHTRVRAIDADSRRLVSLLTPKEIRSPVAGLGAALLALERAILKVYDPLDPLSAGYVELAAEQRIAARDLLSRFTGATPGHDCGSVDAAPAPSLDHGSGGMLQLPADRMGMRVHPRRRIQHTMTVEWQAPSRNRRGSTALLAFAIGVSLLGWRRGLTRRRVWLCPSVISAHLFPPPVRLA